VDEVVLSLYAEGLTTREISAHFAEIYGASVSRETITWVGSLCSFSEDGSALTCCDVWA